MTFDILSNQSTPMALKAVPDDQEFAGQMLLKMAEKLDNLRCSNRTGEQAEVEVPPGDPGHRRQLLPVEVKLQHWGLPPWRPGTATVRALAQSALVDEDDRAPLFCSFVFTTGQRRRFHFRIASSSRSIARPVGRCTLQPSRRRIRQTCPGWYSTPNVSWITSATSHELHSWVSYPRASGPRLRMRSNLLRSFVSSSGLRPARPAFRSADFPDSDTVFAQRYTDCRWTPSCRATSAWLRPRFSRRAASRRRSSRASKSRRTPAGFPMTETVAGMHRYVNYIM